MQLTQRHRKFVNRLLAGATAKDAYLHAFPNAQPSTARTGGPRLRRDPKIQAELAALRQKAEALPDSDFLTYVETRKFYARIVRAHAAALPDQSDLWNVRKSSKGMIYLRFPDKLRATVLDAKLAGYDRPKPASSAESDQLTQLLARTRTSGMPLSNRQSAIPNQQFEAAPPLPRIPFARPFFPSSPTITLFSTVIPATASLP